MERGEGKAGIERREREGGWEGWGDIQWCSETSVCGGGMWGEVGTSSTAFRGES